MLEQKPGRPVYLLSKVREIPFSANDVSTKVSGEVRTDEAEQLASVWLLSDRENISFADSGRLGNAGALMCRLTKQFAETPPAWSRDAACTEPCGQSRKIAWPTPHDHCEAT